MKIQVSNYTDFKALVNDLGAPDSVAYIVMSTTFLVANAFFLNAETVVIGGNSSSPMSCSQATLTGDYASAISVSSLSVT